MNTNNQALPAISILIATKTLQISAVDANDITKSNTASKICASLIALLFIVSMILIPWGTVYAVTPAPVKWHPGHYYKILPGNKNETWYQKQVYSELQATPALRGIQIGYSWAELETAEDVYDFVSIDNHLNKLAAQGKRLIIMLHTRTTDPTDPHDIVIVPDYLKAGIYEGGEFLISGFGSTTAVGKNTKLWNNNVRDRLVKLFQALGNRYNSHPNFEGIGISETAMGQSIVPTTQVQVDSFYANLLFVHQRMREAFPNTMTFQYTNYPRPVIPSIVNLFKTIGGTLSGPDVFLDEPGLVFNKPRKPKGLYTYYPALSGIIPLAIQVEDSNYMNTRNDGTGYEPTVTELLTFARDNLKVNYIFWKRVPGYYPKVLEMLNWSAQTSNLAGGLKSICPTVYAACVD